MGMSYRKHYKIMNLTGAVLSVCYHQYAQAAHASLVALNHSASKLTQGDAIVDTLVLYLWTLGFTNVSFKQEVAHMVRSQPRL